MASKILAGNAHRLVLTATPRQVSLRIAFPTNLPSATAATALDPLKLSITCPSSSKPFVLHHLDVFRDKCTVAIKEDSKTIMPERGSYKCSNSFSRKNTNSFSSQQMQPTSTPTTTVESDASVEYDEDVDDECDNDNHDDDDKYELQFLEDDLNEMSDYNPLQGYSTREVLEDFNPFILKDFPHLRRAINEWYEVSQVPKVFLDGSKKSGGIFEFRVPGDQIKSLARHVGTRYSEWRNKE
ncbi:hypothetical protein HDU81_001982 [Chytriomyces hyalinus]|nr:hypothetical protein HDU81_001982 [Chytriomyces hyalinus]